MRRSRLREWIRPAREWGEIEFSERSGLANLMVRPISFQLGDYVYRAVASEAVMQLAAIG